MSLALLGRGQNGRRVVGDLRGLGQLVLPRGGLLVGLGGGRLLLRWLLLLLLLLLLCRRWLLLLLFLL